MMSDDLDYQGLNYNAQHTIKLLEEEYRKNSSRICAMGWMIEKFASGIKASRELEKDGRYFDARKELDGLLELYENWKKAQS